MKRWELFRPRDGADRMVKVIDMDEERPTHYVLYSEAQEEIEKRNRTISALKSSLNCGDLCAEVTELKAENEKIKKCWEYKAVIDLEAKLSRLTDLIEGDEEAEKVIDISGVDIHPIEDGIRRSAINDYRAMLLDAVKEERK
jgi:hypothetical protein